MNKPRYGYFDSELLSVIRSGQQHATAKSKFTRYLAKARDNWGMLIHYAAAADNVAIINHLIKLGSDVNSLTKDGHTPLMVAVLARSPKAVNALLAVNADIHIVDNQGKNVLHMISHPRYNDIDIIETILHRFYKEVDTIDELVEQLTAAGCSFFSASLLNNIKVLEGLLKRGYDVDFKSYHGQTPLFSAVKENNFELAKWLTDRGANINVTDKYGDSLLFYAVDHRNAKMMKLLLNLGVDPNVESVMGSTPLFILCEEAPDKVADECVDILLQHGALVKNQTEPSSYTIFDWVVHNKSRYKTKLLVAHLAYCEKLGKSVAKSVMYCKAEEHQEALANIEQYYKQCQQILDVTVLDSFLLFDMLAMSEYQMRQFLRRKTSIPNIKDSFIKYDLRRQFPYYFNILFKNFSVAIELVNLEDKVIPIICDLMCGNFDECYLPAKQVAGYLNLQDLKQLSRV